MRPRRLSVWLVTRVSATLLACALVYPGESIARNNVLPADAAVLFDHSQARQEIAAGADPHPTDALTCTWYADLMLRETGSDGPRPGPAFLVPHTAGTARAPCVAPQGEHSQKLETAGSSFIGRKGPFLFFDETDGNGAEGFVVLRVPDGRAVYSDSYDPRGDAGLKSVSLDGSVLHLGYTRAYNGSCSILKDAAACWSKMMQEGHFARAIASQPPPIAACAAAYRPDKTPADDANMILYDVEMTLTPDGKSTVLHRGALGCEPMP